MPTSVVLSPPTAQDPMSRVLQRLTDIERRVDAIERSQGVIPIGGAPGAGEGRDGSLGGDTALRLWLKIAGTWRYTNLT